MKKIACFSFLFCLFYQSIFSQKEKIYKTIQVASPIRIDGHIDEQAWGKVTWAGDFIQTEPENGAKPTFDTQFKIIYDQDNLYVAIRAFDPKPDSIVQSVKPRDFFAGDYVEINIDRDVDKKDAFSFTITAAGIRGDEHIKTHTNWYNDWNPNWTAQTAIDSLGWLAEMQIPFKALEIHNKQKYWGIQVNRSLERLDEGSSWTRIPDEDRWVEYFGRLVGIEQVPISRTFSPTEEIPIALLQQDFDNLFQALELAHPSLYRYQSKYTLTRKYEQVLNALEKGQTLIEYYKLVSAFISKIGDGHMNVELPDYFSTAYYDNQQKLPFNLKIHENEAFIVENYTENDLLNGSRITAINGKAIGELIYESGKLISSDGYNATGKHYKLSNDFDFYYALTVGFSEKVSIDFIPKGGDSIHTMDTKLLTQTELEKINPEKEFIRNNEPFDYRVVENIAILTLRTFNHATGFQEFVDESFNKLAESGIDKLVLDVRGNGGGEEVNAIHLYAYLTQEPFRYYDRYEVKLRPQKNIDPDLPSISFETLDFFGEIASTEDENKGVLVDFEALGDRFIDPNTYQQPKTENNFSGQLIVLIDGGSFSATAELCAIIARDDRAIFIGTETGGGFEGNTSGIYDQITLPNSRIKVRIPLVKYVNATEDALFLYGRGIIPNHFVGGDTFYQKDDKNDPLIRFSIEKFHLEKEE